ncbi:ATP-binding protein [Actinomadura parmotrematis]|uniref:ATP-binding protein n=1 Tax=Actinomadura parmotrematis TaxID=2864039 RepID=A0ABS7FM05_9ACTN|nr:ATP-binding protein [Actinomadura parmotrematis]MBW8481401.1 ATP-binding protein [Actinomadura parmotrematis]
MNAHDHAPAAQPAAISAEIRMNLLAEPSSVVLARELVRYSLTHWEIGRCDVQDAMLVMSEIVTNAVAAARGRRIRLRCALHNGAPLLECWDPSPARPEARPASDTAENGRGLAIIAAYAKECGVRPSATAQGKVVWALMSA